MNKNNTLIRSPEVVIHAACRLIRSGPFVSHLVPGVLLLVERRSPFKAVVRWYAPTGEGPEALADYQANLKNPLYEYYVVDRAWTRLSYWWHRARLGNMLYLRPLQSSDAISRELRLLKLREVMI